MGYKSGLALDNHGNFAFYLYYHTNRIFLNMKWTKEEIIGILLQILFALFATVFIIQLLLKLTGHSPTELQIVYGAIISLIVYSVVASYKLIYKLGRIDEHLSNVDRGVQEVKREIMKIEERLLKIERKIN